MRDFKSARDLIFDSYSVGIEECILFIDESWRGLGKTMLINDLALSLMSDGYKVVVIGCPKCEYYCDKFVSNLYSNLDQTRGLHPNKWAILLDEITVDMYLDLLDILPHKNNLYGWVNGNR